MKSHDEILGRLDKAFSELNSAIREAADASIFIDIWSYDVTQLSDRVRIHTYDYKADLKLRGHL